MTLDEYVEQVQKEYAFKNAIEAIVPDCDNPDGFPSIVYRSGGKRFERRSDGTTVKLEAE